MKKIIFFFILVLFTTGMIYSFIFKYFINYTNTLIYLKEREKVNGNYIFCYERLTLNRYRFSVEKNLFTVLNNLITGPKNIFLESVFSNSLSVYNVYLFDKTLVIDYNEYLTTLSEKDERLLLNVVINTLALNYPEIEDMFWLSQGRKVEYIKSGYSYLYPIPIKISQFNKFNNTDNFLTLDYQSLFPC